MKQRLSRLTNGNRHWNATNNQQFFQKVSKPWLMTKFCDIVQNFKLWGNNKMIIVTTRKSFISPKIYAFFFRWWGSPVEMTSTKIIFEACNLAQNAFHAILVFQNAWSFSLFFHWIDSLGLVTRLQPQKTTVLLHN